MAIKSLTDSVGSKKIKLFGFIIVGLIGISIIKFFLFVDEQRATFKKRQAAKEDLIITTTDNKQMNLDQVASLKSEIDKVRDELKNANLEKEILSSKLDEQINKQNEVLKNLKDEFDAQTKIINSSIDNTNDKIDKTNTLQRNKFTEIKNRIKEINITNSKGKAIKTIELPPLESIGEKPSLTETIKNNKANNNINNTTTNNNDLLKNASPDLLKKAPVVEKKPEPKTEIFGLTNPMISTPSIDLADKETKKQLEEEKNKGNQQNSTPNDDTYTINLGFSNGVTLMGVDAPTSTKGAGEPHPVMITLDGNVINANGSSQSMNKCLLLATATGDLRTERANLRLSKLSCVTADGKERIEAQVQGWVIGEDGKPGLPGVVVTKAGSVIAKGLTAGFLQGVANAFSKAPTLLSPTAADGTVTENAGTSFGEGVATGSSDALNTIAEYYLEMAKDMYPVIEIKPGRKITVLLKGGEQLTKVPFNRLFIGDTYESNSSTENTNKQNVFKRL